MQRFHYDSENRLIHAQTWQGTTLSSEARYQYDAVGRRIGKQVTQNEQTQHTRLLWQGVFAYPRSNTQSDVTWHERTSLA